MMEKFLIVLFILSTIVEPGASLSCVSCMDTTSLRCTGELESCPPYHVCSSSFKVTYLVDGRVLYLNIRSCIPEIQCGLYGTLTVPDGNIIMGIACCKKDACTPSIMARRPVKAKPNGVRCKNCTSGTEFCDTDETMECRGDEDRCINYGILLSSRFNYNAYSFRGCGTKSLCEVQSYTSSASGNDVENRFTCTEAEADPSSEGDIITDPSSEGDIITDPSSENISTSPPSTTSTSARFPTEPTKARPLGSRE